MDEDTKEVLRLLRGKIDSISGRLIGIQVSVWVAVLLLGFLIVWVIR